MIDPEEVDCIFRDCLVAAVSEDPAECLVVEGIVIRVGFAPPMLEKYREKVIEWLRQLPIGFQPLSEGGGGGWSFLMACDDRFGNQWTGLHQRMEQLFMLGIGCGYVSYCAPRETWDLLPGGMPYLLVDLTPKE